MIIMKVERICLGIDGKTKKILDEYGAKHSLSRSAALRVIVNDFFLKQEAQ